MSEQKGSGRMGFPEFLDIETVGCVLAVMVTVQLVLELRSIYLSALSRRGGEFLQIQGLLDPLTANKESLEA